MAQLRQNAPLAVETLGELRIPRHFVRQQFERDISVQARLPCFKYKTHAAPSYQLDYFQLRKGGRYPFQRGYLAGGRGGVAGLRGGCRAFKDTFGTQSTRSVAGHSRAALGTNRFICIHHASFLRRISRQVTPKIESSFLQNRFHACRNQNASCFRLIKDFAHPTTMAKPFHLSEPLIDGLVCQEAVCNLIIISVLLMSNV
jgi:hypothetical protein